MKLCKIISLILAFCVIISVLCIIPVVADDDSGLYQEWGPDTYVPLGDDWAVPITYEELQPGDVVLYQNGKYTGIYAGQDENGNDLIIHDSNEADGINLYHENPSAYVRIIDDGSGYYAGMGMGVGRKGGSSAAAEESGQNAATAVDVTEASEESPTSPTVNQSLTSPKTGGVSCVSTVIFTLIISAVIGTGIFICGLSKKIGS